MYAPRVEPELGEGGALQSPLSDGEGLLVTAVSAAPGAPARGVGVVGGVGGLPPVAQHGVQLILQESFKRRFPKITQSKVLQSRL